jgi:predicted component of type VI protein secretion system
MAKLILTFDDRVVKEYVIGTGATIGRLPDNTVLLDNPAVSGHHARIFHDGEYFVVEDLKSKNGTFVNDKVVLTRRSLRDGDVLLVGKHRLVFDEAVLVDDAEPVFETLGDTVYLDTPEHRAHLARLRAVNVGKRPNPEPGSEQPEQPEQPAARPARLGLLRMLATFWRSAGS